MNYLSFTAIKKIAEAWLDSGGLPEADLAALEPTLWSDGAKNICDVIELLSDMGYSVNMTTNGSTLVTLERSLKNCGLNKLRISWHTLDEKRYKQITSYGNYNKFMQGVNKAISHKENICFNRMLINGHLSDLEKQIAFVDQYGLRLKLYDLYWTKNINSHYKKFYISPEEAISSVKILDNFYLEIINFSKKRERLCFVGPNGGRVEVKLSNSANKHVVFCKNCNYKDNCLEGFGDYFRIFPSGMAGFCYMRSELDRSIIEKYKVNFFTIAQLYERTGQSFTDLQKKIGLRFVLTSVCNYNCKLPGVNSSLCLKAIRSDFHYPTNP